MPDVVIEMLKKERKDQERFKKIVPSYNNENDLVFALENGNHLPTGSVRNEFVRYLSDKDNPVSFHSLRRTCASLIADNLSLKHAQFYLDHSSVKTSLLYVYPSMKDEKHLVDVMDRVMTKAFELADYL